MTHDLLYSWDGGYGCEGRVIRISRTMGFLCEYALCTTCNRAHPYNTYVLVALYYMVDMGRGIF